MKKITILLACLCIVLLLFSCGSDHSSANLQLAVYEISAGSDSGNTSVEQIGDIPWKTANIDSQSSSPEKTKTIIFDGKTYTGNYIYSSTDRFNTHRSNYYEFDGGHFSVNESTNKMDSIVFTVLDAGKVSSTDCESEAFRIASQYININDYELSVTSDEFNHGFQFVRYIDGVETGARLSVIISTTGKLHGMNYTMIDELDAYIKEHGRSDMEATVNLFSSKSSKSLVEKIIDENYDNNAGCSIPSGIRIVSTDGQLGMYYEVKVDLAPVKYDEYTLLPAAVAQIIVTQTS